MFTFAAPVLAKELLESTDPDANTVILAILAAGGTLTASQKTAIENRILAFKAHNIWNILYAYYGFAGSNAASHAINWKTPWIRNIVFNGGGFTHNALGVKGNASSGTFGNFQFSPNNLPQNSLTIAYYTQLLDNNPPTFAYPFGSENSSDKSCVLVSGGSVNYALNASNFGANINHAVGYSSITRSDSSTTRMRVNATTVSYVATSRTRLTDNYFLCARNNNSSPLFLSKDRFGSFAFFSTALSVTQDNNNRTSEIAYQTAMGR